MKRCFLFVACLAAGCSSSSSQNNPTPDSGAADTGADTEPQDTGPTAPAGVEGCMGGQTTVHNYPEGPYGFSVGNTAADVCLQGYLSFDKQTLVPMALHDFFDWAGTTGNSILFLSGSMTWCGPCNSEATQLPTVAKNIAGKGAVIFQVHLDGATYGVGPTEMELKAWTSMYKQPFWVAMDPMRITVDYFPTPHPPALVIDMKTMKILGDLHGYKTAAQLTTLLLNCVNDPTPASCK